jgi:hypothetical protein
LDGYPVILSLEDEEDDDWTVVESTVVGCKEEGIPDSCDMNYGLDGIYSGVTVDGLVYVDIQPINSAFDAVLVVANLVDRDLVYGCTDESAVNYYPAANIEYSLSACLGEEVDASHCCQYFDTQCPEGLGSDILGCTASDACNYCEQCNVDDGSCTYKVTYYYDGDGDEIGCQDETYDFCDSTMAANMGYYVNYGESGSSCLCSDSCGDGDDSCYDGCGMCQPDASTSDSPSWNFSCSGCTDSGALNYNVNCSYKDGDSIIESCKYDCNGDDITDDYTSSDGWNSCCSYIQSGLQFPDIYVQGSKSSNYIGVTLLSGEESYDIQNLLNSSYRVNDDGSPGDLQIFTLGDYYFTKFEDGPLSSGVVQQSVLDGFCEVDEGVPLACVPIDGTCDSQEIEGGTGNCIGSPFFNTSGDTTFKVGQGMDLHVETEGYISWEYSNE